jgi:hypothetical protein
MVLAWIFCLTNFFLIYGSNTVGWNPLDAADSTALLQPFMNADAALLSFATSLLEKLSLKLAENCLKNMIEVNSIVITWLHRVFFLSNQIER